MFTDSHCHLTYPGLRERIDAVCESMRKAQVTRALCICTTMEEFEDLHTLVQGHDNFWCSAGVHPDNEDVIEPTVDSLCAYASLPKVIAIGETGLDYYRLNGRTIEDMEWQRSRFRAHIRAARACKKPLVVHTRSASFDTLTILRDEGEGGDKSGCAGGVFHCFTESLDIARQALDLGYYISFSGIITFNSARDLRDVVAFVPMDRLLIETDSPYLAPVPFRGKTNDPSLVPYVAQQVASIKRMDVEQVAAETSDNFDALFFPHR